MHARYKYGDLWSPTLFLPYYFSKYIHLGFLLIFNISINVFFLFSYKYNHQITRRKRKKVPGKERWIYIIQYFI